MDGITDLMDMSLSKFWEKVKDRKPGMLQSVGSQRVIHERVTELNCKIYELLIHFNIKNTKSKNGQNI